MLPGTVLNLSRKKLYYDQGYWTSDTVFDYFQRTVDKHSNRIAVVDNNDKFSYKELYEQVIKASFILKKLKVSSGDFVSVQLPNWAENIILYLACARIGAIYNPIPISARDEDVKYILNLCESKLFVVPELFRNFNYVEMVHRIKHEVNVKQFLIVDKDRHKKNNNYNHSFALFHILIESNIFDENVTLEHISADSPLIVLFTSGTESKPKGVIHSHNTVLFGERSMCQVLSISQKDAVFLPSPMSHASGFLHGVNMPLLVGAKIVLMDQFNSSKALKLLSSEKCTFSIGATPFLYDLLNEFPLGDPKNNLIHLRFFICGGAPIPRHLVNQAHQFGFKVLASYGSTESPPHTISRLQDNLEILASTDGKPLPGIEVKIVDEDRKTLPIGAIGEESSRGPNVFLGYFKQLEWTKKYLDEEGWYYSGDLCQLKPNNYLQVVGRRKDIIIRGGQNISPSEIEGILHKHPKVYNISIAPIPDPRLGEKCCAFVVPRKGQDFSFDEMIHYLNREGIAKYKYPEKLILLDSLPTTSSGKVQKFKLREMLQELEEIKNEQTN
ncbi:AMP-binding protein [Robertmurraya andreesenii]|uniref:Acyl-CoA synthetase n=1 Tax=Anoxybacillus andreesenii TaxID=1325932 RepID=A0ABT9V235_9BACL|nr:AMP-binding protein [Robertmurraya andreesenii]MDQ0155006.1 acyl-CoA synthetase [Robertmurraya andreesenii]